MGLDIYFTKREKNKLGYFRKVNFLVKYFEDLGFDVENQIPFRISKEDAEDLLSRCNEVLDNHSKADTTLPTMEGFFFGSTDYDDLYFNNVKEIKEFVEDVLLPEFDNLAPNEEIFFEIWY